MSRAFFYGNLTKLAIFLRNWLTDKAKKVFLLISFQCVTCNLGNLHASKNHLKSALLPTSYYTFPSHTGKLKIKKTSNSFQMWTLTSRTRNPSSLTSRRSTRRSRSRPRYIRCLMRNLNDEPPHTPTRRPYIALGCTRTALSCR